MAVGWCGPLLALLVVVFVAPADASCADPAAMSRSTSIFRRIRDTLPPLTFEKHKGQAGV
jgi:hypothetical protein